jgi:hypothetical protein
VSLRRWTRQLALNTIFKTSRGILTTLQLPRRKHQYPSTIRWLPRRPGINKRHPRRRLRIPRTEALRYLILQRCLRLQPHQHPHRRRLVPPIRLPRRPRLHRQQRKPNREPNLHPARLHLLHHPPPRRPPHHKMGTARRRRTLRR